MLKRFLTLLLFAPSASAAALAGSATATLKLPHSPATAATQAAKTVNAALQSYSSKRPPLRLQVTVLGDNVQDANPHLPLHSFCTRLVETLTKDERWDPQKIHFFFDSSASAQAFNKRSSSVATTCHAHVLQLRNHGCKDE